MIILFTSSFPYGNGEQFIETELKILAGFFSEIFIFPYHYGSNKAIRKGLPRNVTIFKPFRDEYHTFIRLLLKGLINTKPLIQYLNDFVIHPEIALSWTKFSLWFRSMLNCRMILQDKRLVNLIAQYRDRLAFYFYWGNRPSGIIAGLKKTKRPTVVRFHRVDLYKELEINQNYIPFQEMVVKYSSQVVCISEHGARYISQKYGKVISKVTVHRLGTIDHGICKGDSSEIFKIISCSAVDDNKRVIQLAMAISDLDFPVLWTHIGDGPLMAELTYICQSVKRSNIKIVLSGRLPNQDVHNIYKSEQFDLFVNLSRSEGVPFSIMEALSYSIPVMATAVGGTPEIVDHFCGHLLPSDFQVEDIQNQLNHFHALDAEAMITLKVNARKRWEEMCNAEKNYSEFAAFLKEV